MKAEALDQKFDDGENVLEHFVLSTIKRPGLETQRIEVDVPQWMLTALDREAQRLGVQRQAVIKVWLAERLDAVGHFRERVTYTTPLTFSLLDDPAKSESV